MARKKATDDEHVGASTPYQQDEADILKEVGAVPANDDSGDLVANEARVLEVGAVDAESVRENRHVDALVGKVRAHEKGVSFNLDNVLEKYDGISKAWGANTIDILVNRVTGAQVQWVIQSRPRSGAELYAAILAHHGHYDEAEYRIQFVDFTTKRKRGTGRIVMPDTRDGQPLPQPTQGQPPPMSPQQPLAPPAAPSTDPVAMMQAMWSMFKQVQAPTLAQQPQAPTLAQQAPQPLPDPMTQMQQMFSLFQQMQTAQQPPQPQQPVMPSPPPQGSDPAAMTAWMMQMFKTMQQPATQPAPPPQVVVQPPPQPAIDPMAMMGQMFDMFRKMQQSVQPPPQQSMGGPGGPYRDPSGQFSPPPRGPYGGGQRPYYGGPQGQQDDPRYPPQQPPQRPKTAAEEFRDATTIVETAISFADRFRPQAPAAEPQYDPRDDDDNPVKVMDVGGVQVLINKDDGSSRKWETVVALVPTLLKWGAEQREAIMKANAERDAKRQRQQKPLPPGYVEVGPGYQAPPGFVAVPVEMGQGFPQPPDEMPPPITQQEEQPRPKRQWDAPPGDGG